MQTIRFNEQQVEITNHMFVNHAVVRTNKDAYIQDSKAFRGFGPR